MLFFRGRNSGLVSESNQKNRENQSRYRPGVPSSDPDWRTGKKETVKVVYLFSSESEFGVGIGIESEKQRKPESIPTRSSESRPRLGNRKKRNSKSSALLSESEFGVGIAIESEKQRKPESIIRRTSERGHRSGNRKKETVKVVDLFSSESEFGVGIGIESENQKIRKLRIDPNPEFRVPTPIGEQKKKKQ